MSDLNEQQFAFVAPHIFKLDRAEYVHTMPQKEGPSPKPVPCRECPSLKLRLSRKDILAKGIFLEKRGGRITIHTFLRHVSDLLT